MSKIGLSCRFDPSHIGPSTAAYGQAADMLIGRHSQADIRLPLPDVSRRHCRFFFGEGVWQVLDLNSLNGVFLNGMGLFDLVNGEFLGPAGERSMLSGNLLFTCSRSELTAFQLPQTQALPEPVGEAERVSAAPALPEQAGKGADGTPSAKYNGYDDVT